jgi:hypothetical protein
VRRADGPARRADVDLGRLKLAGVAGHDRRPVQRRDVKGLRPSQVWRCCGDSALDRALSRAARGTLQALRRRGGQATWADRVTRPSRWLGAASQTNVRNRRNGMPALREISTVARAWRDSKRATNKRAVSTVRLVLVGCF